MNLLKTAVKLIGFLVFGCFISGLLTVVQQKGGPAITGLWIPFGNPSRYITKYVNPAVVQLDCFDAQGQPSNRFGTGFVISRYGRILTSFHVIAQANGVSVTLADGRQYWAREVIYADSTYDLAVLRIDAENVPVVQLGDSDRVEIGQEVYAIGHPYGLSYTLSPGYISSLRKANGIQLLQTTAPISPGNSGGPLLNRHGEVIGVMALQIQTGQALNFATPINYARFLRKTGATISYPLHEYKATTPIRHRFAQE